MNGDWQHHVRVSTNGQMVTARRDFLRWIGASSLAAGAWNWTEAISASAADLRQRGMSCIVLWMAGGPSQFETFAPKPGHAHGGETKAIATKVPGIQIADNLPHCANIADQLAIVRSMTSKEGNHQRASFLLHHGYTPMAAVKYPTLGANVAHQIGEAASELPSFVRIGGDRRNVGGGGFLGVDYDPFVMRSANRPPDNVVPPTSQARFERRMQLLHRLDRDFGGHEGADVVADHHKLLTKAATMMSSKQMAAFDLEKEPAKMRAAYGESEFAAGCLLARRLVEAGVTFVEVTARGWDTHQENFERHRNLTAQIDQPMARLIVDLAERGLLDRTLVVWMGEFGRTPRINPRGGRDHFPRAFSVALAGGGVRGGQVIGDTDEGGVEITQRPVQVTDLFRTIYHALGIDADHENTSLIGRPIKLVDGGSVVKELLA